MADRYWVGNGGDWSDTAHWAQVSNGPGGFSVPDATTSVYFDKYSFSVNDEIVTVDSGDFGICVFGSSCDRFTLNIETELSCNLELHIHTSKVTINGRIVLEAGSKFYGTGTVSEILCKPGSYIYETNHIGSLILDTEGSVGISYFYFEDLKQTHLEQFNILNSSATSKAQIETISGSNYFIIASTSSNEISIQNTRIKGCVVIGDATFKAFLGNGCVNLTPVLNLGWVWYDRPTLNTIVPTTIADDAIRALGEILTTGDGSLEFLEVDDTTVTGPEFTDPPYSEPKNLFEVGKHYNIEGLDSTSTIAIEFSLVDSTSVILYGYKVTTSRLYDNYPTAWNLYAKNTHDIDWTLLDERVDITAYDSSCKITGNSRGYERYKIIFTEFYNTKDLSINKIRCFDENLFVSVQRRGFCYKLGTTGNPTIFNNKVYEDGYFDVGSYDLLMTGLIRTRYYRIRSFAINVGGNSYGVGYGNTITVQTDELFIPNVEIII